MADDEIAPPPERHSPGDPIWDDWNAPPRVPSIPELHLDGFDGPMDVLLDLAERQRINLGPMSILALVDQFLAAMARVAAKVTLERRADWIIVATRLVLLRSRLLFPESPQAAVDAEREAAAAIGRLESLSFIRAAASWLQARPQLGQTVFTRPNNERNPRVASYMALMEACLSVLQTEAADTGEETPVYRPRIAHLFSVNHAMTRIRARLAESRGTETLLAFLPPLPARRNNRLLLAKSAISSTFLASLELTRGGELTLEQDGLFQPIAVTPIKEREPAHLPRDSAAADAAG
jgi:segregation and condensation protein A